MMEMAMLTRSKISTYKKLKAEKQKLKINILEISLYVRTRAKNRKKGSRASGCINRGDKNSKIIAIVTIRIIMLF